MGGKERKERGGGWFGSSRRGHTRVVRDWRSDVCSSDLQVRNHFKETALSAVVVGDERDVRVHIHVEDAAPALSYAESLGAVSDVKIENMDRQNERFAAAGHGAVKEAAALALLPVVQGDGLAHLFRDSGCAGVVEGAQTMNQIGRASCRERV